MALGIGFLQNLAMDNDTSVPLQQLEQQPFSDDCKYGSLLLGSLQVKSLLLKNFTEKRRNIRVTACECFSHLLIVVILVLGFGLSKIRNYSARDYSILDLQVPPGFLKGTNPPALYAPGVLGFINQILTQPVPVPTLDQYISLQKVLTSLTAGLSASELSQSSSYTALGNLLKQGTVR